MLSLLKSFSPLNLKVIVIVAGISLALGAASGWKVRDAFCDAAALRIEVANLNKQLEATRKAALADADSARANAEQLLTLEEKARELQSQIGDGKCLDATDTDRLRDLWKREGQPRARTR